MLWCGLNRAGKQRDPACHLNIYAVVAQSVEHFLGKEEVRQFKPAQQLQSFLNF